jgi:hypothetical protein
MKKGNIELPWDGFSTCDSITAGAFTGAAGIEGPFLRATGALSLRSLAGSTAAPGLKRSRDLQVASGPGRGRDLQVAYGPG